MKVIKIKESLFQSLINDGCAHIILKAGPAEKYTLNEVENGTPVVELLVTENINEETMTKEVIIISNTTSPKRNILISSTHIRRMKVV